MKHFNFLIKALLLGGIFVLFSFSSTQGQNNWEVNGQPSYATWSLYLDNVTIDGNNPDSGDTLAIFVNSTPVGVYSFSGSEDFTNDYQTNYEMTAFSQLDTGEGYSPGDQVTFKYWNESKSDSVTGSFNESVLLNNSSDPNEYLDDGDEVLEFPSGSAPYSYVSLDFVSGHSISGTVSLDQECFATITDVNIIAYDSAINNPDQPEASANPNTSGFYSLNGLTEDSTYVVRYKLDNYQTFKDTITDIQGDSTGRDTTLIADKGVIDLTVKDGLTTDSIESASVKIFTQNDSSLIASTSSVTDTISSFRFDSICKGNYFITTAKNKYLSDTVSSIGITYHGDTATREKTLYRKSGTIVLNINDDSNGDDITGAIVESGDSTATEDNGIYTLERQFGAHDITITKDGYQQKTLTGLQLTPGDTINRDVNIAPLHFQFEGGSSFSHIWTIYIKSAKIDQANLDVNDEIAIYDDGDTLVGTYFVEKKFSETDTLDRYIKAYSQLANGDEGYSDDDTYYVKIYDYSANQELSPNTISIDNTVADGKDPGAYDAAGTGGGTYPSQDIDPAYSYLDLTYLSDQQMSFNLEYGYQMISTNVEINDSIADVFDPVKPSLSLVKNENGNSFRKIGESWSDNIGSWRLEEGYLVKMDTADVLNISGAPITDLSTNQIALDIFNIISYLPTTEKDAKTVFKNGLGVSDLSNSSLDYVRNSNGDHLWYVNSTWKNNIGNMKPGEGYLVKMKTDTATLDYSNVLSSKGITSGKDQKPEYFTFSEGNPTEKIYTMYIRSENLEAGDEVAAFCNGKMVGSTVIEDPDDAMENNLNIFRKLATGEGFEPGSDVVLKIWSPRTKKLYTNPDVEYINEFSGAWMNTTYPSEAQRISFIDLSVKALGVEATPSLANIRVYPNPANNKLSVKSPDEISEIRIINTIGQVVISKEMNTKNHTLNISHLESGVYILQTVVDGHSRSIRFTVK